MARKNPLQTRMCGLFECEYPIMSAGMDIAGPELVAALKEAWAFLVTMPVEAERKQEHFDVAEQCRDAILKTKL